MAFGRRKKAVEPPRARGYQIRFWTDGDYFCTDLPHQWVAEPEVPADWEKVKRDPGVKRAILKRSGRKFATYERS